MPDVKVLQEWSGHKVGEVLRGVHPTTAAVLKKHGLAEAVPDGTDPEVKKEEGRAVPDPSRFKAATENKAVEAK